MSLTVDRHDLPWPEGEHVFLFFLPKKAKVPPLATLSALKHHCHQSDQADWMRRGTRQECLRGALVLVLVLIHVPPVASVPGWGDLFGKPTRLAEAGDAPSMQPSLSVSEVSRVLCAQSGLSVFCLSHMHLLIFKQRSCQSIFMLCVVRACVTVSSQRAC